MRTQVVEVSVPDEGYGAERSIDEISQGPRQLTTHDPLTGIQDRHLFLRSVNHLLARLSAEGKQCALIVLDLDDFSAVNDRFGEATADAILVAVARAITDSVRPTVLTARISGDRFAIACQDAGHGVGAQALVARLLPTLAAIAVDFAPPLALTASAGIAVSDSRCDSEVVVHQAEDALRQAKKSGKGRVRVSDRSSEALTRQVGRPGDLRCALDAGQIGPLFQPIIDLRSGSVNGFEALARWHHPLRGMVGPDAFIPLAERTGVSRLIDHLVLERACETFQSWIGSGLTPTSITMSVNVASSQLIDPTFPEAVGLVLGEFEFPSSQVRLEITESGLIDDDRARVALAELKQIGVQLAIDDFGTGFSSLARFEQLPFDVLKIDKSFIDGITVSRRSRSVVASIIHLADELGLRTVAEGVETRDQLQYLREVGCESGQGYLWSSAVHPSLAFEQARLAA